MKIFDSVSGESTSQGVTFRAIANNNSNIIFDWENMQNKPQLANKLELTQSELILKSDDDSMSSVPLMEDNDIDIIISQL